MKLDEKHSNKPQHVQSQHSRRLVHSLELLQRLSAQVNGASPDQSYALVFGPYGGGFDGAWNDTSSFDHSRKQLRVNVWLAALDSACVRRLNVRRSMCNATHVDSSATAELQGRWHRGQRDLCIQSAAQQLCQLPAFCRSLATPAASIMPAEQPLQAQS